MGRWRIPCGHHGAGREGYRLSGSGRRARHERPSVQGALDATGLRPDQAPRRASRVPARSRGLAPQGLRAQWGGAAWPAVLLRSIRRGDLARRQGRRVRDWHPEQRDPFQDHEGVVVSPPRQRHAIGGGGRAPSSRTGSNPGNPVGPVPARSAVRRQGQWPIGVAGRSVWAHRKSAAQHRRLPGC